MPEKGSKKIGEGLGYVSILNGKAYAARDPRLIGLGSPPRDPDSPVTENIPLQSTMVEIWETAEGALEVKPKPTTVAE